MELEELVVRILTKLNIKADLIVKRAYRKYPEITAYSLIKGILKYNSTAEYATTIGYSKSSVENIIKDFRVLVNNEQLTTSILVAGIKYRTALLAIVGCKFCSKCLGIKNIEEFHLHKSRIDNRQGICKDCSSTEHKELYVVDKAYYKFNANKYRCSKMWATPKWADLQKIEDIYSSCPEGYHVDHWAPLQGELVCGLHVHENLQYLTAAENLAKGNKFEIR